MKSILPPAWFLASLVLMTALHLWLPLRHVLIFPWRLAGLVPLVAGLVLNILADREFKHHQTTVKPFETSSTLISRGVFRLSRNPMYLGLVMILAGIAVLFGSVSPWVVVVAFALLLDRAFIEPEEEMLRKSFGDDFRAYCKTVRRWV